ncbi:hypothetical protein ACFY12_25720 [Streptomyces sp. NPDC001339]|uniref:hypothetical protein n=1 Tax=Streptomyces sp. NPDC001339 TaxID=3364563 RepID=UPI00368DCE8E
MTPLLVPHVPACDASLGNPGAPSADATGFPLTQMRAAHTPSNRLAAGRTRS